MTVIQSFTIPNPPSVNQLYRNTSVSERVFAAKAGRKMPGRVKTPRYAEWINAAGWDLKLAKLKPYDKPVEVSIWIGARGRSRFDLDNCAKSIGDLLVEHGVIQGDTHKHIIAWHIHWRNADKTEVSIRPAFASTVRQLFGEEAAQGQEPPLPEAAE